MEKNKLYTKELGWDKKKRAIFLLEELEDNYVVSDLYANQYRLTKPLKEELEEYKYKKGEKTLFSKLIKKIEKLHQNKKKEKEIQQKNYQLSKEISDEMTNYEENLDEFTAKTVKKATKDIGLHDVWVNDKQGEEKITINCDKQYAKYAQPSDFPFLYTEYDGTLHYHNFDINEYFDVKIVEYYKTRLEDAAKTQKMNISFEENFEMGDKNTIYLGIQIGISSKNKMNMKKFKEFLKAIDFMSDFDREKHVIIKRKK